MVVREFLSCWRRGGGVCAASGPRGASTCRCNHVSGCRNCRPLRLDHGCRHHGVARRVAERAAEKGRHLEALTAARVEKSRALKALAASQRVQKVMEGLSREQESEKDGRGEGKNGTKKGEKGKGAGGLTMESCRGCLELHELRGEQPPLLLGPTSS